MPKEGLHPQYFNDIKIRCACGNLVEAGSTMKEIVTDICSACHPFFTGKQKLIDTAGRVEKFNTRFKTVANAAESKAAAAKKKS